MREEKEKSFIKVLFKSLIITFKSDEIKTVKEGQVSLTNQIWSLKMLDEKI